MTRTDLEVAWGGRWGCPQVNNKQCTAFVQGAMCEAEKKDENDDGKIRRYLNDNNNENDNANDNDNGNENDNNQNAMEEENEELENENEDLEEDLEEEEEAVAEESEELEEYEEYTEELEEEVIDMEDYTYYYDDDMMYDSYWDEMDWGSVWVRNLLESTYPNEMQKLFYFGAISLWPHPFIICESSFL